MYLYLKKKNYIKLKKKTEIFLKVLIIFFNIGFLYSEENNPIKLYNEAMTDFENKDYYTSISKLKNSIYLNENYIDALIGISKVYFYIDQYDEAFMYIENAKKKDPDNNIILTLEGNILLALDKINEADEKFDEVLKKNPYNIDAIIGKAKKSILNGNLTQALTYLTYSNNFNYSISNIDKNNKKLLLSLAIIYDSLEDTDKVIEYINNLIRYYPYDEQVQLFSANFYFKNNYIDRALIAINNILNLNEKDTNALILLSKIEIKRNNYQIALDTINRILEFDKENLNIYYLKAYLLSELNRHKEAIISIRLGLKIHSDDEILRILLKNEIIKEYNNLTDENRKEEAKYYFNLANSLKQNNLFSDAVFFYKTALQLDPNNINGRYKLLDIYLNRNYKSYYFNQIKFIKETIGDTSKKTNDLYDIYESEIKNSVANDWDLDQFNQIDNGYSFQIFFKPNENYDHNYYKAESLLVYDFQRILQEHSLISFKKESDFITKDFSPQEILSNNDAFKKAKKNESDYYIILDINNVNYNTDLDVTASLFLTRTGHELKKINIHESGNFSIFKSFKKISENISNLLAKNGSIIARYDKKAVINLGKMDGIKLEDEFSIIKKHALKLNNTNVGLNYEANNLIAKAKVIRLDDKISEIKIENLDINNVLSLKDKVIGKNSNNISINNNIIKYNFYDIYNKIKNIK